MLLFLVRNNAVSTFVLAASMESTTLPLVFGNGILFDRNNKISGYDA